MLIEYPGLNITAISILGNKGNETFLGTGSHGESKNSLQLWKQQDDQLELQSTKSVSGDILSIVPVNKTLIAVSTSNGDINLFNWSPGTGFNSLSSHKVSEESINEMILLSTRPLILSCSDDGSLNMFHVETKIESNHSVSKTAITALDEISGNEVVCGNFAGHLKLFDLRTHKVASDLFSALHPITTVKRNPSNPHYVASGSESGDVALWDLRKDSAILQFRAHEAMVTKLMYKADDSNLMLSSSFDGQLVKWNMLHPSQLNNVEALVCPQSSLGPAINTFDININRNEVIYSTEKQVLSIISLF